MTEQKFKITDRIAISEQEKNTHIYIYIYIYQKLPQQIYNVLEKSFETFYHVVFLEVCKSYGNWL